MFRGRVVGHRPVCTGYSLLSEGMVVEFGGNVRLALVSFMKKRSAEWAIRVVFRTVMPFCSVLDSGSSPE